MQYDYFSGHPRKQGDPVALVSDRLKGGVGASSAYTGYLRAPVRSVGVTREEDLIGEAMVEGSPTAGWLLQSFASCDDSGLKLHPW